jgi:chromosome segregation ATPase
MFGKSDLVDSLNRDLARARDKRDALTSGVATLTAQIAELEARLSAENDRRERERAANEIEGVKKQVRDRYLQFASAIAGLRDATEMAVAIVPETRELNEFLVRELQRSRKHCFWAGGMGMRTTNHANRFKPGTRTKTCSASQTANRNHGTIILAYHVPRAVV